MSSIVPPPGFLESDAPVCSVYRFRRFPGSARNPRCHPRQGSRGVSVLVEGRTAADKPRPGPIVFVRDDELCKDHEAPEHLPTLGTRDSRGADCPRDDEVVGVVGVLHRDPSERPTPVRVFWWQPDPPEEVVTFVSGPERVELVLTEV